MLVGYVSNERYVALGDVLFEFRGSERVVAARSNISGAIYADVSPGDYEVVLGKDGYGSKVVTMTVDASDPYQFRLLSDGLYGYMWPKCVKSGEFSEFRVHAVEEYELELWRYGAEKEFIRRIGIFDEHGPRATMQITPDGDYTQLGVEWNKHGYHSKAMAQFVEGPERSGLYYLHARSRSGDFFSFPWVVAPSSPQSKVAVLASDVNWNAYNSFGGRSNYIHADCFPPTPTINSRLELKRYTEKEHRTYDSETYAPLSLDRPDPYNHIDEQEGLTDPIRGRQGCHMAAAEWRLLGWMERNGIDYDYYSETQLHFDQVPLQEYRVLILSTHPEYWSRHMYDRLKRWVFEEGGRLMYLGGNGLNCEVEFLDDHRIVYHNTKWSHSEPQYADDGREYESRMDKRYESEANLLGVAFTFPGIMTAAPYQVLNADHWCFHGTGLRNGDTFGEKSLHLRVPGGASGHETDKVTAQSPANVQKLARGLNPNGGGAEIVTFDTPNGGAVFSVGSICWPASILVDDAVSRITQTVLNRFLDDGA
ncbi:MAG: carboxypeptidase regulatory-like domain-containing protein [Planctomycetaceae bacterium]|nr:carboxypeptidase regulatory-like domain-containing protein [Planctomycetaceae bacterium]